MKKHFLHKFVAPLYLASCIYLGLPGHAHATSPFDITSVAIEIAERVGYPAHHDHQVSRAELGLDDSNYVHLDLGGSYVQHHADHTCSGFTTSLNVNTTHLPEDRTSDYPIPNLVYLKHWPSIQKHQSKIDHPLPLSGEFADYITLQKLPLTEALICEIARCLRPGGEVGLWLDQNQDQSLEYVRKLSELLGGEIEWNAADEFEDESRFKKIKLQKKSPLNLVYTTDTSHRMVWNANQVLQSKSFSKNLGWTYQLMRLQLHKSQLFLAHTGMDGKIYLSSQSRSPEWTDIYTPNERWRTNYGIDLMSDGNQLHLCHISTADHTILHASSTDGRQWSDPIQVHAGWVTNQPPSLIHFDGQYHLAHTGQDQRIYMSVSQNVKAWSDVTLPNASWRTTLPVSLAVHNRTLYLSHVSVDGSIVISSTPDLRAWTDTALNQSVWKTEHGVRLISQSNHLNLMFVDTQGEICMATSHQGQQWLPNLIERKGIFITSDQNADMAFGH